MSIDETGRIPAYGKGFSVSRDGKAEIRLEEEELRQITRFAATSAAQVLPLFEENCPLDSRPRDAIAQAERFAAGGLRTAALRASAWAAYAAARAAGDGAAAHAAYAASHAAAAAYLHPIASPHQVKHILGAAVHQALAVELGARDDSTIGDAQLRWAVDHAPLAVGNVLGRFPPPRRGRGRFNEILCALDAALRE